MSHYALCKATIKNPDRALLRSVLSKIAFRLNAKLVERAEVYGWAFRKKVDFLVELPLEYGNGYGVEITDDGEVIIHVDDHGAPLTGKQFQDLLQREYMAEAVKEVMMEMGYEVDEDRQGEVITIRAFGW